MALAVETEVVRLNIENKVATLTLNRPEKLNAFNTELLQAATAHLKQLARDPEVGAIVVTGEGRAFCAGGDVSQMAKGSSVAAGATSAPLEQKVDGLREGQELSWLLYSIPKVTIAMVNGFAMGAGLGIALCCDLRIASDGAKFGTAYAKVGFGGDFGTSWQLTRLVGPAKAKELFFTAEIIMTAEAHRIGLVNRVVAHASLGEETKNLAEQIANGPLVSFRYMKENVNLAVDSDFRTILDREAMTHLRCGETEDHKEGVAAFMEKRAPKFRGR
jgi:2-(1,2-epoxy-1,2-dihydrophenyl)acetyl-CoA isomerase